LTKKHKKNIIKYQESTAIQCEIKIMSTIPMTNIKAPYAHDVLSGRGGATYKHVGNYTFRYLILLNKAAYVTCKKSEKIKISRSIVNAIRQQDPPGRFLAYNQESGFWNDIGDMKAILKTSQALRERQPDFREKILSVPNTPSINTQSQLSINQNNRANGECLTTFCRTKNELEDVYPSENISSPGRSAIEMLNEPSPEKINEGQEEEVIQLICETFRTPSKPKVKHLAHSIEKPFARKLYNQEGKGVTFVSPFHGSNKKARKDLKPFNFLNRAA